MFLGARRANLLLAAARSGYGLRGRGNDRPQSHRVPVARRVRVQLPQPGSSPGVSGLEARADVHEFARQAAVHGANDARARAHAHGRFLSAAADQVWGGIRLCSRVRRHESRPHRWLVDRDTLGTGRLLYGDYGHGSRLPLRQFGPLLPPCGAEFRRYRPPGRKHDGQPHLPGEGHTRPVSPTTGSGPAPDGGTAEMGSARRGGA